MKKLLYSLLLASFVISVQASSGKNFAELYRSYRQSLQSKANANSALNWAHRSGNDNEKMAIAAVVRDKNLNPTGVAGARYKQFLLMLSQHGGKEALMKSPAHGGGGGGAAAAAAGRRRRPASSGAASHGGGGGGGGGGGAPAATDEDYDSDGSGGEEDEGGGDAAAAAGGAAAPHFDYPPAAQDQVDALSRALEAVAQTSPAAYQTATQRANRVARASMAAPYKLGRLGSKRKEVRTKHKTRSLKKGAVKKRKSTSKKKRHARKKRRA